MIPPEYSAQVVESSNSGGGGGVSSCTTSGLSTDEYTPVVNITQPEINLELSIGLPVVSDHKAVTVAAAAAAAAHMSPVSLFSMYKENSDGCGLLYNNEHSISFGRFDFLSSRWR